MGTLPKILGASHVVKQSLKFIIFILARMWGMRVSHEYMQYIDCERCVTHFSLSSAHWDNVMARVDAQLYKCLWLRHVRVIEPCLRLVLFLEPVVERTEAAVVHIYARSRFMWVRCAEALRRALSSHRTTVEVDVTIHAHRYSEWTSFVIDWRKRKGQFKASWSL